MRGLREFTFLLNLPFNIVVTKEKLDSTGNTVCVPLWIFLLMC